MKRCVNCRVPARCLLCADCWRAAIVSPLLVFAVEKIVGHFFLLCVLCASAF